MDIKIKNMIFAVFYISHHILIVMLITLCLQKAPC